MLSFATGVFIAASIANVVNGECQNGCNGHGACTSFDMCICYNNWMGNECNQRICPFGRAHVDSPKGDLDMSETITGSDLPMAFNHPMYPYGTTERYPQMEDTDNRPITNSAHDYMECSNKGSCDRTTGECECYDGYDGVACQRASCPGYPNVCYGHGVCKSARNIAKSTYGNQYELWDSDSTMGCVCDPGYYGPDCRSRDCRYGVDPLYLDDIATAAVGVYDFGVLTTGTQFSDGMAASGNDNGKWAIRFFDNWGDDWLTEAIPAWATCEQVVDALEKLPNSVIKKGTVECRVTEYTTSTGALTWTTSYINNAQVGGPTVHTYTLYYKMATWATKSNPELINLPNSWVTNAQESANEALAPSFVGDIYRLKFTDNGGRLREPQIELYLDGKRPALVGVGDETIVTFVVTDGHQGEDEDHLADHCDDVTLSINPPADADDPTSYSTLGNMDAGEIERLKRCLGDADGDESNNVERYNWDHGDSVNPHLVKIVRTQDKFGDGGYYAAIYYDSGSSEFRLINPLAPPDGLDTDWYDIYTTKGTLAQTSPTATAFFGFGQHHIITTVTTFQSSTDNETLYDGNIACDGDNSLTNVPNCLKYDDYFTMLDFNNPRANSPHINLYSAKRIWTKEWKHSVSDSVTGFSGSEKPLHRGIHVIETDLSTNWGGDDSAANGYGFSVYRFRPSSASTYRYVAPCSNRGTCDPDTGLCHCFTGYYQSACDEQNVVVL